MALYDHPRIAAMISSIPNISWQEIEQLILETITATIGYGPLHRTYSFHGHLFLREQLYYLIKKTHAYTLERQLFLSSGELFIDVPTLLPFVHYVDTIITHLSAAHSLWKIGAIHICDMEYAQNTLRFHLVSNPALDEIYLLYVASIEQDASIYLMSMTRTGIIFNQALCYSCESQPHWYTEENDGTESVRITKPELHELLYHMKYQYILASPEKRDVYDAHELLAPLMCPSD